MIPQPDQDLTGDEQTRWQLTKLAAALVRSGQSIDTVMLDCRQGCDIGRRVGPDGPPTSGVDLTAGGAR